MSSGAMGWRERETYTQGHAEMQSSPGVCIGFSPPAGGSK